MLNETTLAQRNTTAESLIRGSRIVKLRKTKSRDSFRRGWETKVIRYKVLVMRHLCVRHGKCNTMMMRNKSPCA